VADLSTVRVLAVDDSVPWRGFVTAHLGTIPVQVVGTAVDGLEAIQKARALQPNIVIMDIRMPKLNGLAATREICRVVPSARVLIASNEMDPEVVQAAFAAGACGYVLKRTVAADLRPAIAAVAGGKLFIGRGLSGGDRDDSRRNVAACE
jgi:DNA-binding NarL/FixJ family response regulator